MTDLTRDRHRTLILVAAATVATLIKLLLAWFTFGTNDVATWAAFAANAKLCGACVYELPGPYGDPFNHPPFIIHFLKLLPDGPLFPFVLRLPSIVADIGTIYFVSRLLPSLRTLVLVVLCLNPISLLISGFHGNTDPMMVCWILAALYFVKKEHYWMAGFAFGMALNVKVLPLLLLPTFLLHVHKRGIFSGSALITFMVPALPYMLHLKTIVGSVLGYKGLFINWGITHYADLAGLPLHLFAGTSRNLIVLAGIALPLVLRRKACSPYVVCAVVLFMFYSITPTLALQYLVWGVPFVAVLSIKWMLSYYLLGGSLIALQYHRWSNGKWIFAESHSVLPATAETEFLSFALWITCAAIWSYLIYSCRRQIDR